MRTARMLLSGLALLICLLPLSAAEVELVEAGTIDIGLLIPIIAASIGTVTLWQWILPLSLGNLQVAFEVDDDLRVLDRTHVRQGVHHQVEDDLLKAIAIGIHHLGI